MDESRLDALEKRLAKLEATFEKCYDGLFCRDVELDCKVTTLETMLRDYGTVVRMVAASYRATHPKEAKAFLEGDDSLGDASKRKPADKS